MTDNIFDPTNHITTIVLVGLGGTGSHLGRAIARIAYDMKRKHMSNPTIRFVDPDVVESANVGRSLFTANDVGQPKSAILARRLNAALGLEIEYHVETYVAKKHSSYGSLLCGAVDNHLARREMAKSGSLWLDAGNHRDGGQVILGNTNDIERVINQNWTAKVQNLPNAALLFPALLEPEQSLTDVAITDQSCAEMMEIGMQGLLVNDLMATIMAHYVHKIMMRLPIHTFLSFADGQGPSIRSIPINREEVLTRLTSRQANGA